MGFCNKGQLDYSKVNNWKTDFFYSAAWFFRRKLNFLWIMGIVFGRRLVISSWDYLNILDVSVE